MANGKSLPKKTKKKTTAKLRKELWVVFTKFIKSRDKYTCFTCGNKASGYGMGGGHYKPKGACGNIYYYSEVNVHAQCTYCNLILQGNQVIYRLKLIEKYGLETVEKIEKNFRETDKYYPYQEKIDYYKTKLKEFDDKDMQQMQTGFQTAVT